MAAKKLEPAEFADILSDSLVGGFDVVKIARSAFDIYRLFGSRLTPEMDKILLVLMAMEEGPEFELSETEFLDLIDQIRTM